MYLTDVSFRSEEPLIILALNMLTEAAFFFIHLYLMAIAGHRVSQHSNGTSVTPEFVEVLSALHSELLTARLSQPLSMSGGQLDRQTDRWHSRKCISAATSWWWKPACMISSSINEDEKSFHSTSLGLRYGDLGLKCAGRVRCSGGQIPYSICKWYGVKLLCFCSFQCIQNWEKP